jgi:serine/threonine protein kinase
MISNKYNIIEKLSEGSYGIVCKAQNLRTNEFVAIKFESKTSRSKTLKNEAKIYQHLGKQNGFPQLKWFGSENEYSYLVIDLLGVSLSKIITQFKTISLKTIIIVGMQMIKRVQVLHNKDLLHRDIKPDNFLFGTEKDTNKLYLVDFGFSKRYNYNGNHINEKTISTLVGSPNFVSTNIHKGIEPSRRDDIESCLYILIYMFFGTLEWTNKNSNEMLELKQNIIEKNELPTFIKIMLQYVHNMTFTEAPNYDYLINIMANEFKQHHFKDDDCFEWSG